jgi:hypothetical protein
VQRRGTAPGTVRARPLTTEGARRRVRTVLAKPGVECSPDLPRGLRRVSESAPISRRRVDQYRRCNRPTRGGDSIYDRQIGLLTGEPILPAQTANQYLANQFYRRKPRTNIWPDIEQRWQPLGDGRWGRVVGREGTERSVGRSHVWKESGLLNWGRAK